MGKIESPVGDPFADTRNVLPALPSLRSVLAHQKLIHPSPPGPAMLQKTTRAAMQNESITPGPARALKRGRPPSHRSPGERSPAIPSSFRWQAPSRIPPRGVSMQARRRAVIRLLKTSSGTSLGREKTGSTESRGASAGRGRPHGH